MLNVRWIATCVKEKRFGNGFCDGGLRSVGLGQDHDAVTDSSAIGAEK